jgi:hypothetical protein
MTPAEARADLSGAHAALLTDTIEFCVGAFVRIARTLPGLIELSSKVSLR